MQALPFDRASRRSEKLSDAAEILAVLEGCEEASLTLPNDSPNFHINSSTAGATLQSFAEAHLPLFGLHFGTVCARDSAVQRTIGRVKNVKIDENELTPFFLDFCIQLLSDSKVLTEEGLLRVSPSAVALEDLCQSVDLLYSNAQIDQGDFEKLPQKLWDMLQQACSTDPHIIAGALKRFVRLLPTSTSDSSIVPTEASSAARLIFSLSSAHHHFTDSDDISSLGISGKLSATDGSVGLLSPDIVDEVREIVRPSEGEPILQPFQVVSFHRLCTFFSAVARNAGKNLMSLDNIVRVFTPTLHTFPGLLVCCVAYCDQVFEEGTKIESMSEKKARMRQANMSTLRSDFRLSIPVAPRPTLVGPTAAAVGWTCSNGKDVRDAREPSSAHLKRPLGIGIGAFRAGFIPDKPADKADVEELLRSERPADDSATTVLDEGTDSSLTETLPLRDIAAAASATELSRDVAAFLKEADWWLGDFPRERAEELLRSCGTESFLVRTSSQPGCFAVSRYITVSNEISHFLLRPSGSNANATAKPLEVDLMLADRESEIYHGVLDFVARCPELVGFLPLKRAQRLVEYRRLLIQQLYRGECTFVESLEGLNPTVAKVIQPTLAVEFLSQLEIVRAVHVSFADALRPRIEKWGEHTETHNTVADLLLQFEPQLTASWTNFIERHLDLAQDSNALEAVTRALGNILANRNGIADEQNSSSADGAGCTKLRPFVAFQLDVPSVLLLPSERLRQFAALIEDLLSHTWTSHPERYLGVDEFRVRMNSLAELMGEKMAGVVSSDFSSVVGIRRRMTNRMANALMTSASKTVETRYAL